jgi:hypothetical protein
MPNCRPETRESAVTPVQVIAVLLLNSSLTKPKTSHDDRAFQPHAACGRLAFLYMIDNALQSLQRSHRKIMAVAPKNLSRRSKLAVEIAQTWFEYSGSPLVPPK